ncbi:hypothetical protein VHTUMSATKI_28840 [Vibrio harveyi]|uniref:glycosyltransferase family 2 protein n=1 Tax=Vibrio harveyi TaxID=669 RepID=UPI0036F1A301
MPLCEKLVSVIIPTFNRPELLRNAIFSAISQTYKNIEVIVIDDASTEDNSGVIDTFENKTISYIRLDSSKGANYARNLGVSVSKGDYIAFLDDDDEWLESKIESQLNLIEEDPDIGLVYTGARVVDLSCDNEYFIYPKEVGDLSNKILISNYIGTTSSVLMKKSIFDQVLGFDELMPQLQDYDLWIRVSQVTKIGAISTPLINYYIHRSTTQITSSVEKNKESIEIIDRKYARLIHRLPKKLQKFRYGQRYNAMGKRILKSGDKKGARKLFVKSFLYHPNLKSLKFYIVSFLNYSFVINVKNKFFN